MILSAGYLGSILMVSAPMEKLAVLNPSIGAATALTMTFFGSNEGIKTIYIYIGFPFLGGFLALFFYEIIFKKIRRSLKKGGAENTIVQNDLNEDDEILIDSTPQTHLMKGINDSVDE